MSERLTENISAGGGKSFAAQERFNTRLKHTVRVYGIGTENRFDGVAGIQMIGQVRLTGI